MEKFIKECARLVLEVKTPLIDRRSSLFLVTFFHSQLIVFLLWYRTLYECESTDLIDDAFLLSLSLHLRHSLWSSSIFPRYIVRFIVSEKICGYFIWADRFTMFFFFIFPRPVDRYFWIILSFLSFFFNSFDILYHAPCFCFWVDESFSIYHPDPAEFSRSRRCSGCLGRSSYARHLLSLRLPWCDPVRLFVHSPRNCHRSGPTQRKVQHSHWYGVH